MDIPDAKRSSRRRTREEGVFTRDTPGSQTLARGLLLLRAFRSGIVVQSNTELAEFTGLPRPTVSRLAGTLVEAGFLDYDIDTMSYRLGPPLLTLGRGARQSSRILPLALPAMRSVADRLMVNVGLAVHDFGEMVYIESIRRNRLGQFRRARPGDRLPVADTALGRAWLSTLEPEARAEFLRRVAGRYADHWPAVADEVRGALSQYRRLGWCQAEYRQGELTSIAMPLRFKGLRVHALNLSYPTEESSKQMRYAQELLELGATIAAAVSDAIPHRIVTS
jgi:DNA-binding IclR family transcriptional regulator